MNINEQEMDAYEISEKIFSSETPINLTIHNSDLKNYFEMLLIITTEGLKKFYGDEKKQVYIGNLSLKDIEKINRYLKKINVKMNIINFNMKEWCNQYKNYPLFNTIIINNKTKLEDLYYIVNSEIIYVINFSFLI